MAPAKGLMKVDANLLPAHAYLGIAGLTGLTAYAGIKRIIGLKEGETLWMSAGAGAVGSAGIQFAKAMGAKVIATAGGKAKTDFCLEIGADAAIDYKAVPDLRKAIKDAAPGGIDAYFENVGGDHLVAALDVLKQFGRIAACGMISRYNDEAPSPGPHNMTKYRHQIADDARLHRHRAFRPAGRVHQGPLQLDDGRQGKEPRDGL